MDRTQRKAKLFLFIAVALIWLILDQATKYCMTFEEVGQTLYQSNLGIMDIMVVHNTGGAWGIFSDATWALAVFSLIVCVLILVYVFVTLRTSSMLTIVALSLVFAGGLGNVVDRLCHGYVIDFLSFAFMDFPVFNVADIGVTVGVVLFLVSLIMAGRKAQDGSADKSQGN